MKSHFVKSKGHVWSVALTNFANLSLSYNHWTICHNVIECFFRTELFDSSDTASQRFGPGRTLDAHAIFAQCLAGDDGS